MQIRPANLDEHKELCRIARSHRAGNGFTNGLMFSGEVHYSKGWLRVAVQPDILNPGKELILGFTCVRHKVREPKTSLYYIIVDSGARQRGVGQALLDDLIATTPHRCIELSCLKDNDAALKFYEKNGFKIVGEAIKGTCHHLEKNW